jgi:hypothetical protein
MKNNLKIGLVLLAILVALGVIYFKIDKGTNKKDCEPIGKQTNEEIDQTKAYIKDKSHWIKIKHDSLSKLYSIGDPEMNKVIDMKRWYEISQTYLIDVDDYTEKLNNCNITTAKMTNLTKTIKAQQDSVMQLAKNLLVN